MSESHIPSRTVQSKLRRAWRDCSDIRKTSQINLMSRWRRGGPISLWSASVDNCDDICGAVIVYGSDIISWLYNMWALPSAAHNHLMKIYCSKFLSKPTFESNAKSAGRVRGQPSQDVRSQRLLVQWTSGVQIWKAESELSSNPQRAKLCLIWESQIVATIYGELRITPWSSVFIKPSKIHATT